MTRSKRLALVGFLGLALGFGATLARSHTLDPEALGHLLPEKVIEYRYQPASVCRVGELGVEVTSLIKEDPVPPYFNFIRITCGQRLVDRVLKPCAIAMSSNAWTIGAVRSEVRSLSTGWGVDEKPCLPVPEPPHEIAMLAGLIALATLSRQRAARH